MNEAAFQTLWGVLGGILTLNPDAFSALRSLPDVNVDTASLTIVLLAGLSQELAQAIILFVNRVQPLRFVVSLLLGAVLFVFGYIFWGLSVWAVGLVFLSPAIPLQTVADVLAFSYLPLVFSFFGAMPYLGVPILRLLAVWNLLAMVVGFSVLADLSARVAFGHVLGGWVVLITLQQTVGQPVANLGKWLFNKAAGVKIVRDQEAVKELIYGAFPELEQAPQAGALTQGAGAGSDLSLELGQGANALEGPVMRESKASAGPSYPPALDPAVYGPETHPPTDLAPRPKHRRVDRRLVQRLLQLLGLALLALLIVVSLDPLRNVLDNWYSQSDPLLAFVFDLFWISLVALAFGALLAPIEALGWWAGWYGDDIQTTEPSDVSLPDEPDSACNRYIVYLDGIGQTDQDYQPAVAHFLEELENSLPQDMQLIKGLMSYSVLNRALTQDRPLAFFWRLADQFKDWRLGGWLLSLLINVRNVLVVSVSADLRYGPIFNRGIAQQIYTTLLEEGYPVQGGIPITLIGYSGGGQIAMGVLPFLKRALRIPIEVVSLGGVISGNVRALEVEQLYHLVGKKDVVERLGPIFFPRRWPISKLSYWNRAKEKGRISFISLGPVGHQIPGGIMDPDAYLDDGRSNLQQTLDLTLDILNGDMRKLLEARRLNLEDPGTYYFYQAAAFNQISNYPLHQTVDSTLYRPIGEWVGRLILPAREKRRKLGGVLFEIHQAPLDFAHYVGQVVPLRWAHSPGVKDRLRRVIRDIHFSAETEYSYRQGLIHPIRLNHWRMVDPLESLAGARPLNDMVVKLSGSVQVWEQRLGENEPTEMGAIALHISQDPVQVSGRFYALVKFVGPVNNSLEDYRVVHYSRKTQDFTGPEDVVCLPEVVPDLNDTRAAVNQEIEHSPANPQGWYIYGAKDTSGRFVVQSLLPRSLLRLQPDQFITDARDGYHFIRQDAWHDLVKQKGTTRSVLISPHHTTPEAALADWREGDQALLVHVYGGIGGNKREPAAKGPVYFGHFAYGMATVVREPLADELIFDIVYRQVYTHNAFGIVAGRLHWSRYMGDRQWGFLGTRPVSDILIKLPAYTQPFDFDGHRRCALTGLINQLDVMTARYRTGDGTGGTFIGPANNCAQDSNQALYASVKRLEEAINRDQAYFRQWADEHPEQAQRFAQLLKLRRSIQRQLLPFGSARADWETSDRTLGSNIEDFPLKSLGRGLVSWRTMLPRKASDTVTKVFLDHGATLWVLRTNQVGGYDPDIEPISPLTL
ncbi:CAAX protease [Pseudanabaena sp. FACHB-2040]|uniref:CAAX protease n=1 Tax=Pseudanabaena sp. FACHB-2040 TaxID=2692859 RepID=UPI0016898A0E|nr:CAAX protease [Pseudanabaena sp. FACHB-2040]MBD2256598.1 CAAX protease [Pseudanabaena sp. FACHB-2040]